MEARGIADSPGEIPQGLSPAWLERLAQASRTAAAQLVAERTTEGHWTGELSSSALSTATAVIALSLMQRDAVESVPTNAPGDSIREPREIKSKEQQRCTNAIQAGLRWLAEHANPDGGWGDTVHSFSNISTTALGWAAFGLAPGEERLPAAGRAKAWLANDILGNASAELTPEVLAQAVIQRYGKDRTFSVPILTACALAGRLGSGSGAWKHVFPLPFELAALPHQSFAALRLPVVSYALPALIAIGYARHFHLPSRNPAARLVRTFSRSRVLGRLSEIQPSSGGFLEATPLTSFVVMSLAGSGLAAHPVALRSRGFLLRSQRADGSWPIDTDLATWVTTLASNALLENPLQGRLPETTCVAIQQWLLTQQYRVEHPYTHAAPGGWAWTNLPGGVPDSDDTAGALLALSRLCRTSCKNEDTLAAAQAGVGWLLGLQNRDGGLPTFCRGWGALPFDRSSPDLTAHAIRAWLTWLPELPAPLSNRVRTGVSRALDFLAHTQHKDGSWSPLWFGNQHAPGEENLTYGTSRVLLALVEAMREFPRCEATLAHAVDWLVTGQPTGGAGSGQVVEGEAELGWGGAPGIAPSTEETALALEALAAVAMLRSLPSGISGSRLNSAICAGTRWLVRRVESGDYKLPSPIGFYFARLWYYERLYPQIFTVAALTRLTRLLDNRTQEPTPNQRL